MTLAARGDLRVWPRLVVKSFLVEALLSAMNLLRLRFVCFRLGLGVFGQLVLLAAYHVI